MYVAIRHPCVHQSITSALSHSKYCTSKKSTMAYKEIHPQQQSRRDRDRQQRGIETPEERRRTLERLKQNRESGTQEAALSVNNQQCELEDEKVLAK